jgi:hypothetical protein
MSPYEKAFEKWRERCRFWLRCERGRTSALARHLSVRRQTVWRWFNNSWSKIPGWAAVAINIYYYQHVGRENDQMLKEQQKAGPLVPPSERRAGPARVFRQEELPALSLPRRTTVVPVERDKLVPGSGDNASRLSQERQVAASIMH